MRDRVVLRVLTFSALALGPASLVLTTLPPDADAASTAAAAALREVPAASITTAIPQSYRNTAVRVLLVGDSLALTLGIGLQGALSAHPDEYGHVRLLNEGIPGCGVADGTTGIEQGTTFVVDPPCTPDPQRADCPPGGVFGPRQDVPCQAWTAAWTDWVHELQPNVVVFLAGGNEVKDRLYDGAMTNLLNPKFAGYVKGQLEKAVRIATAGGALMVMMTKPCQRTGPQTDGAPWPEDSPARTEVYNHLVREVAAAHPGRVYVQDLNSYVCPGGTYMQDLRGVTVRQPDGLHFAMQSGSGGGYLAPAILPYWVELGHLQEASTDGASSHVGPLPHFFAPA